jgi:signal transduction histidine kinase
MRPTSKRVSLASAIEAVHFPWWTFYVISALAIAPAIAVLIDSNSSLPWIVVFALLAVSVAATIADEFIASPPDLLLALVGIGALVPIVVTGGNRLVLVIALTLVFLGTAFGPLVGSVLILAASCGLVALAAIYAPGLAVWPFAIGSMFVVWLTGLGTKQVLTVVEQLRDTEQMLAEEATREERRRLAREVHDLIAHSMTVTLLHVNGARLALRDEPEAADEALHRAERVGRASLDDLRRTVRLLSENSDPTLANTVDLSDDLLRLRDGFSGGETQITLQVAGDTEGLPPFVALTVFRIVQESLTNAARHAAGSCVFARIDVGEERISMRIENSMGSGIEHPGGPGRGLHGMFERATLLGGHLEAGPTKEGWLVTGWVPCGTPPAGIEA